LKQINLFFVEIEKKIKFKALRPTINAAYLFQKQNEKMLLYFILLCAVDEMKYSLKYFKFE
jgi:hypothetical protein